VGNQPENRLLCNARTCSRLSKPMQRPPSLPAYSSGEIEAKHPAVLSSCQENVYRLSKCVRVWRRIYLSLLFLTIRSEKLIGSHDRFIHLLLWKDIRFVRRAQGLICLVSLGVELQFGPPLSCQKAQSRAKKAEGFCTYLTGRTSNVHLDSHPIAAVFFSNISISSSSDPPLPLYLSP
jgi:hypothetical protein